VPRPRCDLLTGSNRRNPLTLKKLAHDVAADAAPVNPCGRPGRQPDPRMPVAGRQLFAGNYSPAITGRQLFAGNYWPERLGLIHRHDLTTHVVPAVGAYDMRGNRRTTLRADRQLAGAFRVVSATRTGPRIGLLAFGNSHFSTSTRPANSGPTTRLRQDRQAAHRRNRLRACQADPLPGADAGFVAATRRFTSATTGAAGGRITVPQGGPRIDSRGAWQAADARDPSE